MRHRRRVKELLVQEAGGKCILCSNCHAEVEDGFISLPDTVLRGSW
jgi:hypothetical protein